MLFGKNRDFYVLNRFIRLNPLVQVLHFVKLSATLVMFYQFDYNLLQSCKWNNFGARNKLGLSWKQKHFFTLYQAQIHATNYPFLCKYWCAYILLFSFWDRTFNVLHLRVRFKKEFSWKDCIHHIAQNLRKNISRFLYDIKTLKTWM